MQQKKNFLKKKKNAIRIAKNFSNEKLSNQYYKVYRKLI